jgi:pimeloyl-ACP methyl ester carboxylesterase
MPVSDIAATAADMPAVEGVRHRFVDLPGLRVHAAHAGIGDPVIMLHGLPQHWWQWRAVATGLSGRYHLICPDARGFGWSQAESARIDRYAMRDDVMALLDALELDRVRIVAHDMGALVAAQLAYTHPERVRAMVVLSVPPPFMRLGPGMLPAMRHVPKLRFRRPGSALDWVFRPPYVATAMSDETMAAYFARCVTRRRMGRSVRCTADCWSAERCPRSSRARIADSGCVPGAVQELIQEFFARA